MKKKVEINTPHGTGIIEDIWVSELGFLMVKVYLVGQARWISFNLATHDADNNIFTNAIKENGC